MKQRLLLALVAVIGLWASPAPAQTFGKVTGVCKDADGTPIAGATVRFLNTENGQKFDLKTNNKGEYLSIGITPGNAYTVTLIRNGVEVDHLAKVPVATGENPPINFDLKANQQASLKQQGLTDEQAKEMQGKMQQQNTAAAKQADIVKVLNEKILAAKTASDAGDYDTAIATLNDAMQVDATHDLVWYRLGEAYSQSSTKQSDMAEKSKRLDSAVTDLMKAIDLKKQDMGSDTKADAAATAAANKILAAYYNSLGGAYSKEGKTDDAVQAFNTAAQTDPSNAGMYFFNQGAIMTNGGHVDEAIAAFDKALAADPTKAAAYYWKGVNLMGKATLKDNKMVPAPGTTEALNKYLELEPTGKYADAAKQLLDSMGATIETSYGKKKAAAAKK